MQRGGSITNRDSGSESLSVGNGVARYGVKSIWCRPVGVFNWGGMNLS